MSDKIIYRLILALAVFSGLGHAFFGISALLSPEKLLPAGSVVNDAATTFARYMAGRNLAIVIILGIAILKQNRQLLGYLFLLNGVVQGFDTVFGFMGKGPVIQTVAPLILCLLSLLASGYLLRKITSN